MAEQASHISRLIDSPFNVAPFIYLYPVSMNREAKGLQQGLKEALKNRDPWDKEIEFQRKKYVCCSRFHFMAKGPKVYVDSTSACF
jgi:hypothetical protein